MKILAIDIETAPATAYVWSLWKENIPLQRLIKPGRIMCFSAKWLGTRDVIFEAEWETSHKAMIKAAHRLMSEADVILTFNGDKFDIPNLNREFLKLRLDPPAPFLTIDLYKIVRRRFRFISNKLAHVVKELGIGEKEDTRGFETWEGCMNGDLVAQRDMKKYCKQDSRLLEDLYNCVLSWIDNHPNYALYLEDPTDPTCPNCGGDDLHKRGRQYNRTHSYQRYQCNDCGTWSRARLASGKVSPILTNAR